MRSASSVPAADGSGRPDLNRAFEGGPIPLGQVGGGLVRRLQEIENSGVRIGRATNSGERKDKLAQVWMIDRAGGANPIAREASRLGVGVSVEDRLRDRPAAGPEAGTAH